MGTVFHFWVIGRSGLIYKAFLLCPVLDNTSGQFYSRDLFSGLSILLAGGPG